MKISAKQYAQLIFEEVNNIEDKEKINEILKKIVGLILKNKDKKKIKQITLELENILKKSEGNIEGEVISTSSLEDRMVTIKERLADKYNTEPMKINLKNTLDKNIQGGIIVKIGNEIFDWSVKTKLAKLKNNLS